MEESFASIREQGTRVVCRRTRHWWREPTVWLLLIATSIAYFSRLTERPMRGEETRRGLVAAEMMQSGDWIVPREQGEPFLSRPPLQNWIIAGFASIRGEVDRWSVRAPSVIALVMTVLLLYGYGRQFLSTIGATTMAIAYATTGQVLEMGSLGETESMYILMVAGSLLLWHWGWCANWNRTITWCLGYALAAAGMLAKGPQGPIYFVVPVLAFLVGSGQWRLILTRSHAIGILVFLAIWNAWNLPFWMQVGTESMVQMYRHDIALRFNDDRWAPLITHLVRYPAEILVCLLPWSLLFPAMLLPSFWRSDIRTNALLQFHLIAIGTTFLSVWFVVGAKTRYFMPLYPCFCVLVAVIVERCFQAETDHRLRRLMDTASSAKFARPCFWIASWRRFQFGVITAMMIGVILSILAIFTDIGTKLSVDPIRMIAIICATIVLLVVMARAFLSTKDLESEVDHAWQWKQTNALLATAVFIWLGYFGVAMDPIIANTFDISADVAEVREHIPDSEHLASTGPISHWFSYHFGKTIPIVGSNPDQWPSDTNYVCYYSAYPPSKSERYRLETVGEVIVESAASDDPFPLKIVVAKRLDDRIAVNEFESVSPRR